ncbi:MAG: hypothetical protein CVU39_07750 [Chloroflexi bacterium HGW-Chloroflexi-10]|nr:MAG: hypothetical protein CVU39_07750 [Chloroflexi bacterium HGW-Chloroflexi-10]
MLLPSPRDPIYTPDTWHRQNYQFVACLKLEDSIGLYKASRYMASIYLAGYAIESAFQALYCFQRGLLKTDHGGAKAHNVTTFLTFLDTTTQNVISLNYPNAWANISLYWGGGGVFNLRYNPNSTSQNDARTFLCSVLVIHEYLSGEINRLSIPPGMVPVSTPTSYSNLSNSIHSSLKTELEYGGTGF